VQAPNLKIVDDILWDSVQLRLRDVQDNTLRRQSGQLIAGRPHQASLGGRLPKDQPIPYLLSGFIRCTCGSGFEALSRASGKTRIRVYGCRDYKRRGTCSNRALMLMETADQEVINAVEYAVFREDVVAEVTQRFIAAIEGNQPAREIDRLERELNQVKKAFSNLLALADAGGKDIAGLLSRMREKQAQQQALEAQIATLKAQQKQGVDLKKAERWITEQLADWRRLLKNNREQGRQVLEHVLIPLPGETDRRLVFELHGDHYRFRGGAVLSRVLTGKLAATIWRPQRDSNPCFSLERAVS
jgi:hypothetical protein